MIKPLADNPRDGYVKQKQQESRNRSIVDVEFKVDVKQAEREIDKAMKYITGKLNKK